MPETPQLTILSAPAVIDIEAIRQETAADPHFAKVMTKLAEDPEGSTKFQLRQGTLYYKNRLVLSRASSLIPTILQMYHNSVIGGHSGFLRTYKRFTGELYWPGLKEDVKKHVMECDVCQQHKTEALSPAGLLQPPPLPERIWEDLTMDCGSIALI